MYPEDSTADGRESRPVLERFKDDARVEARMLKEGEPVTATARKTLVDGLRGYQQTHLVKAQPGKAAGQPISLAKLAGPIGTSPSTLSEWLKGSYKGDDDRISRMVDAFLAREDQRGQRANLRGYAPIRLAVEVVSPAIAAAVLRRSIAIITGEPGSGKSLCAKYYAERNEGVVLIDCDGVDADAKFVVDALHEALKLGTYSPHARQKKREIVAYLQSHQNTVIIVDEAQSLTADALEILRRLHDKSDPDGVHNVPVILFGDQEFAKLVASAREGGRNKLTPQFAGRAFPVVSLEREGLQVDGDGQVIGDSVYTTADIEAIVKNQRLRLVRPEALAWAAWLANLHNHSRLRMAARVLEIAIDIRRGAQVEVSDLEAALTLFSGPSEAKLCMAEIKRIEATATAAVAVG